MPIKNHYKTLYTYRGRILRCKCRGYDWRYDVNNYDIHTIGRADVSDEIRLCKYCNLYRWYIGEKIKKEI